MTALFWAGSSFFAICREWRTIRRICPRPDGQMDGRICIGRGADVARRPLAGRVRKCVQIG